MHQIMSNVVARFARWGVFVCVVLTTQALSPTSVATGTEYYVSPDGHDGGPGTISQPWKTLGKANRTLLPGDTLLIRKGVFEEVIEPFHSGTPGRPIVYRNYQDEQVILRGIPNAEAIVSIGWDITGGGWEGKSYIIVEGLCLSERYHVGKVGGEYYPSHVLVYGVNSMHNEIRDCLVRRDDPLAKAREYGELDYGIAVSKAGRNTVEGNCIQGMTRVGIIVGGGGCGNVVRNNVVLDCICSSVDIGSSMGIIQGTVIENNVLGGSITEDGIQFEPDYRLAFDDGSNQGVIIRGNVICDNAENAIDLKGASNIVIEGNVIFGNRGDNKGQYHDPPDRSGGAGGIMHGSGTGSRNVIIRRNVVYDNLGGVDVSPGYRIYNNVVIYNNRDYTGPDSTYGAALRPGEPNDVSVGSDGARKPVFAGLSIYSGPDDVVILNNIVGGHHGAEVVLDPRIGHSFRIDCNLYFNLPDAKFAVFLAPFQWDTIALPLWRARLLNLADVTGSDLRSLVAVPVFQELYGPLLGDQSDCPFCLPEGSPGIDAGDFLTRTASAGSGTRLGLQDTGFFFDGFGIVPGDTIQLEGSEETYCIDSVDRAGNAIVVDRPLTWRESQGVGLLYDGLAPDIGVCEYREGL